MACVARVAWGRVGRDAGDSDPLREMILETDRHSVRCVGHVVARARSHHVAIQTDAVCHAFVVRPAIGHEDNGCRP